MGSALIGLAAAVVGVTGTLMATVLSQRLMARVQSQQFAHQQQEAEAQWLREQHVVETSGAARATRTSTRPSAATGRS